VWGAAVLDEAAVMRPDLLTGRDTRSIWMPHLGKALTDTLAPIRSILMVAVNAMVSVPNTELVRQGLLRDDLFTVIHDQFLTDTARYADIVLPATTQIEASDVVISWGHLYTGWNEAAIPPRGETVSNSELHRRLAAAMGYTEPLLFEDDITVLRSALPSVDLARLRAEGFLRVPYPADGRPFAEGGFPTPSGKVLLRCDALLADGQPALPTYTPANETPTAQYPFALLTPKQHTRFLNSSYSHLPKHGPLEGSPYVELVADDAARLGLAEGQLARVRNGRGALELSVKITDRLRPGVVAVPWGWWGTQHTDGRVANSLTNDALTDWGGGVAYSDTAVAVEAVAAV
ncbi:MAG: molybdopterin dinucleotide binding domain-containing protein, partial [Actinomycetota bacterium]